MKRFSNRALKPYGVLFLSMLLASGLSLYAHAQEVKPATLAFQGYLIDAEDNPVDGTVNLAFRLYDAATGGTAQWAEDQLDVPVTQGIFSVHLGQETSFEAVSFDRSLWLGVQVNGGSEMVPRVALEAAPYSLRARSVDDAALAAGNNVTIQRDGEALEITAWSPWYMDSLTQSLSYLNGNVGIGTDIPASRLTVLGTIQSTSGGFRFPDGTVQTTAASGEGEGWRLGGNLGTDPAADFMGTRDNVPLEVRVNNARALRILPGFYDSGSKAAPNILFGIASNTIGEGVRAATIGGGGDIFNPNEITVNYGTIGGGWGNTVTGNGATVGGGGNNDAIGEQATIGGGSANEANGAYATVAGGLFNRANGDHSMAAGARASAIHEGTFVWADNSSVIGFSSTGANQYLIRAVGGVGIGTNNPAADLHLFADSDTRPHLLLEEDENNDYARLRMKNVSSPQYWDIAAGAANTERLNFFASNGRGNVMSLHATGDPLVMHNGAKLTEGGTWTNASSRALKTDFRPVDGQAVLARLAGVPVQTWRYKAEAGARHMGPTAEAFAAAFGLGDTDAAIATVDADGVALAAIQALHEIVQQQQAQIDALRAALLEQDRMPEAGKDETISRVSTGQ